MAVHSHQSVVNRIVDEESVSEEEAQRRFDAMQQFLQVCATATRPVSPSLPIDSAWHAFILHTRDYTEYCQERFGRFIHHQPSGNGARVESRENYIRARAIAEELFDELDEDMWPTTTNDLLAAGRCNPQDPSPFDKNGSLVPVAAARCDDTPMDE